MKSAIVAEPCAFLDLKMCIRDSIAGVCVAIIIIAIIAGWGLNQEKKEEKAA